MVLSISTLRKRIAFFLIVLANVLFGLYGNAQEEITIQINWLEPLELKYEGKSVVAPQIEGQELDNGKPVFYWTRKLKNQNYSFDLLSFETASATNEDVKYLQDLGLQIGESPFIDFKVTDAGSEYYAVVYCIPYVLENGLLKRIVSLRFNLSLKSPTALMEKDFAANSVLQTGSGVWYKIQVKSDGVYKIDKAFLESCGISTVGLNPQHINIFGNADGRLPELNSLPRTDDLAKNAIFISGEGDGTFDEGDYILFYGFGPHRWSVGGDAMFDQNRNVYSDNSCYFININSSDIPLRIQTLGNSTGTITNTVNTYSFRDVHELDLVSLVKAGQRWYGELFDTELERTINFNVPNIVSADSVYFETALATNAKTSGGTGQRFSVNGVVLEDSPLPGVSSDFVVSKKEMSLYNPPAIIPFKITITRNSPSMLVYLDRIVMNCRRSLVFTGQQFNFRDVRSVGLGNVSSFQISSFPSNGFVWDITDRHQPKWIGGNLMGGTFSFIQNTDSLREFTASNGIDFLIPERVGSVEYQDLHGLTQAEYLIVSHKDFISQANRLADLHRANGMTVHVVTTEQVFNEFSSGSPDPTAIKMFAKMFYDRGAIDPQTRPKYLLLFGDGTYDPKNRVANNNNFVLTYQFLESENHIAAMVSDDYYGMLGPNESITPSDMLDIGIGRLLVSDLQTAKQQVDKIEHYMKNGSGLFNSSSTNCCCDAEGNSSTFGDWRLNYVQIADDEEDGYFIIYDTEPQFEHVKSEHTAMNCDKLYLDAFSQVTSAGGQRYPDIYSAITNRVERGALIINYVGHGGEVGLSEERVVTVPQIQEWKNIDRMNLFVSATCEFTKYDDPSRVSAGEWASLNPNGAAIALMTTTRAVYFGVNTITGKRFYENVFTRDADLEPKTFGEIIRLTKNQSGASDNKRSFTLIGDPALKIALPRLQVVTDSINGLDPLIEIDTLRALSKVTIKGHLEDQSGNILSSYNGTLSPSIFDKPKIQQTLGQDPDSPILSFELQRNIVYRGKASIVNGYFEFSFVVPKDISFSYGFGKISYYANNSVTDAAGFDTLLVIGGIDTAGVDDVSGPVVDLFLNDENFVSGGITDATPILIAKVFDENGVNTVGNGIGHDLMAVIDGETENPIILNEYYTADLDSYQSGTVRYAFPELSQGQHTLTLKVWDVNNNSSESTLDFVVQENGEVVLDHVLNYPNPFTTHTEFFFEHNQVCSELETQVQILTVSGRVVRTINQMVNTEGFRSEGIPWDGKDDFGDQLAKGVYVYILSVRTPDGKIAEKLEKLVLLK